MIERISPPGVPTPRGPYSPAVPAGAFIFLGRPVALDPTTPQLISRDGRPPTPPVLNNIKRIREGAGAAMSDIVKCGVFLADGNDFAAMNVVYAEFFGEVKPARSTVVTGFAMAGVQVEIDAIVYHPK